MNQRNKTKKFPLLLILFVRLKNFLKCRTYHLEQFFVAVVLVALAIFTKKGIVEWIGVVAVFLNFGHVSVAERLREAEEQRHIQKEKVTVDCYKKLDYYYYSKEIFWLVYFVLLGAYSALAGIVLFLLYRPWRTYYRKYFPINK